MDWSMEVAVMIASVVGAVVGGVAGVFGCWLWSRLQIRMYQTLYENEKNGNFVMTERLSELEEERSSF
jgi:hypothetical protein